MTAQRLTVTETMAVTLQPQLKFQLINITLAVGRVHNLSEACVVFSDIHCSPNSTSGALKRSSDSMTTIIKVNDDSDDVTGVSRWTETGVRPITVDTRGSVNACVIQTVVRQRSTFCGFTFPAYKMSQPN